MTSQSALLKEHVKQNPNLLRVGEVASHENGHLHGDHHAGGDADERPEAATEGRQGADDVGDPVHRRLAREVVQHLSHGHREAPTAPRRLWLDHIERGT